MTEPNDPKRSWRDAVLDALVRMAQRHGTDVVRRKDLRNEELPTIVKETQSQGATPSYTLSKILQELRDEGLLEFLDSGVYRVTNRPVDVEESDLTVAEIDELLRRRLLRIGRVETGTAEARARSRRGQERVRELTLENYGSQCAVCDVGETGLLIASHILRWADSPDGRGDLSNVACFCRFHDILFEHGYWSLNDDLSVVLRPSLKSQTVRTLLPCEMRFRRPVALPPNSLYLAAHRIRHGF